MSTLYGFKYVSCYCTVCDERKKTKELALMNSFEALSCIPLTSSVRFRKWDIVPCLCLTPCRYVFVSVLLSTSQYISVVLLICLIWPWTIRQVEEWCWNETHPFPLSAICCCCNDLREDGEAKKPIENDSWTSQLCSSLMPWPASPPGTVCFLGNRKRSGSVCLRHEWWYVGWLMLYIKS